jgi:hypothetical protein
MSSQARFSISSVSDSTKYEPANGSTESAVRDHLLGAQRDSG